MLFSIYIKKLEKILESASNSKSTKVEIQNVVETVAPETNNENSMAGSNVNTKQKSTGRITTVSRAILDENHAAPTGKYSASLSTNVIAYGF